MFGEDKMIDWEGKADTYKTLAICKSYSKELCAKQKIYNKAMGGNTVLKAQQTRGRRT